MLRPILNRRHRFLALFILLVVCTHTATAQSTGFTYQGRLNDNNQVANGNYDFEFNLFTALTGGTQDGTSRQVLNEAVSNGVFTVLVDFGAGAFPGADRFPEIAVRPAPLFHLEYLPDMFRTPLTVEVSSEKRAVLEATMVSVDEMTRYMKLDFETLESSTARGTGATAARGDLRAPPDARSMASNGNAPNSYNLLSDRDIPNLRIT